MPGTHSDIRKIKKLIELVEESGHSELEIPKVKSHALAVQFLPQVS